MRVRIHIVWLVCWCLGRGAFLAPAAEKLNPPGPTTNIVLPVPPPPPLPKSPVPYFRELLAMSPAQLREKLDRQLAAWLSLPPERRQRMCDNFRRFFELSPAEKRKTLGALSDAERQEMEKSLQAFAKLPPSQIRICVNSFRKFANM